MRAFPWIKNGVGVAGLLLAVLLVGSWAVRGVPTIVFIDAQGRERPELRLVDFLEPEAFARRMDQLLNIDTREE